MDKFKEDLQNLIYEILRNDEAKFAEIIKEYVDLKTKDVETLIHLKTEEIDCAFSSENLEADNAYY